VHIGKNGEEIIADTEVKFMQKLHQIYSGTVLPEEGRLFALMIVKQHLLPAFRRKEDSHLL
jgi:hypothetical protein